MTGGDDKSNLIAELLESPLDDDPGGGGTGWGALIVVLVGATAILAAWLSGGPEFAGAASSTTVATTTAGGTTVPAGGGTVPGTSAAASTTVPEEEDPDPGAVLWQQMVGTADGRVVMFGGLSYPTQFAGVPSEDTWILDVESGAWTRVAPEIAPSPRSGHAMVFYPPTNEVLLFGGGSPEVGGACRLVRRCPGPQDEQLWAFDVVTRTWRNLTPETLPEGEWPEFRYGAAMAVDESTGDVVLFGGVGVFGGRNPLFYDDTWVLDVAAVQWRRIPVAEPPPGRTFHSMASLTGTIYMFGGDGPAGADDGRLWSLDLENERWVDVPFEEGPTSRWMSAMVAEPFGSRLILVGGEGNRFNQVSESVSIREIAELDEVWSWSPAEGWVLLAPLPFDLWWASATTELDSGLILLHDTHEVLEYDPGPDTWEPVAG
jgi:hypothetical protein